MKKVWSVVLAAAMIVSLSACGSGEKDTTAAETPKQTEAATQAEETKAPAADTTAAGAEVSGEIGEHHWVCGVASPKDAVAFYYIDKMAQELDARTGGKITIDVYPDSTLGDDVALLESLGTRNVNFVVQNPAPEVNLMPKLAVFDLPFAFQNIQDFRTAIDSEALMSQLRPIYEEGGYQLLGFADQTFRVMSSNKKVEKIEDFAGIKIRTMENKNHMALWEALGASPTPMAFSEVYTCLQQKVIDAQENPYATIASSKIQEVQDYIIQTNHLAHPIVMIMNLEEYNELNDAEKQVIAEAFEVAKAYGREMADKQEGEKLEEIKASGTEIVPVSDELYKACVEKVQPVYDQVAEQVGEELVNAFLGR
ncbi:TRAP transporter substrate-binding protein [Hominifimenecus sp. rT4P-3]|uniref:TRAP transporter substrate-binding protein n=1 Tax=Hominifimenecus sp. rT4P-3 TaxID=3242979 RepID=UPI003DA37220